MFTEFVLLYGAITLSLLTSGLVLTRVASSKWMLRLSKRIMLNTMEVFSNEEVKID